MSPDLYEYRGIRKFSDDAIQKQLESTYALMNASEPGTVTAVVDYVTKDKKVEGSVVAKTSSGQWTVVVAGSHDFGTKDTVARLGVRWRPG